VFPESSDARAGVCAAEAPSESHLPSSKPVELAAAPTDIADARRHLSYATEEALRAFAVRQLRARRRLTELLAFYRTHPCRLAHVHLLAAAAVTLGRFCGFSIAYDEMGDAFMPVTPGLSPRGNAWKAYADACDRGRPIETRDELWLEAHFADLAAVREAGLEARFHAEARGRSEPTWQLLTEHVEVTLGTRLMVGSALSGTLAYETAVAHTLAAGISRLFRTGWGLLHRYTSEAIRALLWPAREPQRGIVSNRAAALTLLGQAWWSFRARHVYRRGLRARERGRRADGDAWPLLAQVLGERVREVDPLIVRFYSNPSRFSVRASLELHTLPARFWSRLATFLVGQGLYESEGEFEARFRVFQRQDGSMHFTRELDAGGVLRVFDSDFVVRSHRGRRTLFEVFVDEGVEVAMRVAPLPGGGLSIRGEEVRLRGLPLPVPGLRVEFRSHVARDSEGESLLIDGFLLMQPDTRLGRFFLRGLLRRPEQLACIHYRVRETSSAADS
jgi:hypothetical protein